VCVLYLALCVREREDVCINYIIFYFILSTLSFYLQLSHEVILISS
jgi:hypothetical protein